MIQGLAAMLYLEAAYSTEQWRGKQYMHTTKCVKNNKKKKIKKKKQKQKKKHEYITKTCVYLSFWPPKPHFYIVKLGFTGV